MRLAKITPLKSGKFLAAHWANNRGRGCDNCTLSIIERPEDRGENVKTTKCTIQIRTGSWAGDVNVSKAIQMALGIVRSDILI